MAMAMVMTVVMAVAMATVMVPLRRRCYRRSIPCPPRCPSPPLLRPLRPSSRSHRLRPTDHRLHFPLRPAHHSRKHVPVARHCHWRPLAHQHASCQLPPYLSNPPLVRHPPRSVLGHRRPMLGVKQAKLKEIQQLFLHSHPLTYRRQAALLYKTYRLCTVCVLA